MEKLTVDKCLEFIMDKKILLVGASPAGRGIYKELINRSLENSMIFWVDKKYNFYRKCGLPVISQGEIDKSAVNAVVISGERNLSFGKQIIEKYGLQRLPCCFIAGESENLSDLEYPNLHYTDEPIIDEELELINPIELITDERLDIVIRYIACKEILLGKSDLGVEAYRLLSMSMNDGEEYVRPFTTCAYFSAYEAKKGFDAFFDDFKRLTESMKNNGFLKEHFIPLSEKGGVINGTHRIAAALALGKKVYVKRYIGFGEPFLSFNQEDLIRIGYSEEQIKIIINTFKEIKKGNY